MNVWDTKQKMGCLRSGGGHKRPSLSPPPNSLRYSMLWFLPLGLPTALEPSFAPSLGPCSGDLPPTRSPQVLLTPITIILCTYLWKISGAPEVSSALCRLYMEAKWNHLSLECVTPSWKKLPFRCDHWEFGACWKWWCFWNFVLLP